MPPNKAAVPDPNYAEFSQLPHLASTVDHAMRADGSAKRFPIWNTEYGYVTCPPNCSRRWASPTAAATYINWAEYLSWRNPRIASTMQFLLYDPNPTVGTPEYGGFASGLVFFSGKPKPSYYAYRLPLFLPSNRTRRGHATEVWGDVRPAPYAVKDGDGPQFVEIQFQRSGSRSWTNLKQLQVTDPHGYINTWVKFPASGWVRLSWTYPPNDTALQSTMVVNSNGTVTSRSAHVTITR